MDVIESSQIAVTKQTDQQCAKELQFVAKLIDRDSVGLTRDARLRIRSLLNEAARRVRYRNYKKQA